MRSRRCFVLSRVLLALVVVLVLVLLQAGPGGPAQEGPWFTARKVCLLALLAITWALIAFCVISGAGVCISLMRRLRGDSVDETRPEENDLRPLEKT